MQLLEQAPAPGEVPGAKHARLLGIFREHDPECRGVVHCDALQKALFAAGEGLTAEETALLGELLGEMAEEGEVQYQDFVDWLYAPTSAHVEATLQKARRLLRRAQVAHARCMFDEADGLFHTAAQLTGEALGEEHLEYGQRLQDLGRVAAQAGQSLKAEECLTRSAQIVKGALGDRHSTYCSCLNQLGDFYSSSGRLEEAEKMYLEALDITAHVCGDTHPGHAIQLRYLEKTLEARGKQERASELRLMIERHPSRH